MHERERPASLLGLHPLLRYYDTPIILLGLISSIRMTLPELLTPTTCRIAMMINMKNDAMTTVTATIR